MPTELRHLSIEEISLVDEPANKGARVVLLKRAQESQEAPQMDPEVQKQINTLTESVQRLEKTNAQLVATSSALAQIAKAADVAGVKAAVAEFEKAGYKDEQVSVAASERTTELEKAGASASSKAFRDKLPKSLQKAFDEMDDEERSAFMRSYGKAEKADDPILRAIAAVTKTNETLLARLETIETAQELAAARAELTDVVPAAEVEETAKSLIALRKANADAANAMLERLRSVSKAARAAGVLTVIGQATGQETSAMKRLDSAVTDYRKRHPEVSVAKATDAVLREDPGLYSDYLAEQEAA